MAFDTACPCADDESAVAEPSRFLARQPILDRDRQLAGYELLLRTGWENHFRGEMEQAVRQSLDNYLTMGSEAFVGGTLAFVNCTHEALVSGLAKLLPPATTVLEVLETVEPDAAVVKACRELRELGYRIALDDFVPRKELQPLIEIADYIKVDFRLSDATMRREIHAMARGSHAALLAEKVEDGAEFETARAEGYEYFQGYFFCRPKIVAGREIPPNRMNYLRLMIELTRRPLNFEAVRGILRSEASLLYRLLRLANSPMSGRRSNVTSIRDAMVLVGEERFRTLVSVAAASALGQDQPPVLVSLALERARFCELLAPHLGLSSTEQFLLGLLSVMDAMLEVPIESIANSLPLRAEAKAALMTTQGPVALPLCLVRGFEGGAWGTGSGTADAFGIGGETLTQLYVESVTWAAAVQAASR